MLFCTFKLFHNSEKGGNAFYFFLTPKYPVSQWTQVIVYNPSILSNPRTADTPLLHTADSFALPIIIVRKQYLWP